MSNTDLNVLQQKFTTELNKLVNWLEINRLVLNIKKTNFMIFSNKKNINVDSVSIKDKKHTNTTCFSCEIPWRNNR